MRMVVRWALVAWVANASALTAMAAEGVKGELEVKVADLQVAGVPVVLELTIKNTGKQDMDYWCGGPDRYPPADGYEAVWVDEAGRERRTKLSNGQYTMGSGNGVAIKPEEIVKFPAATDPLPAGKLTLKTVSVGESSYQPSPDAPKVVTWPAMQAKPGTVVEVKDDAAGAKAFGEDLLRRVRAGESFAEHVAIHHKVAIVIDALVRDLESEDPKVCLTASEALYHLDGHPKGLGAVIKRAVAKQLAREDVDRWTVSSLAVLGAYEGSDESLDAVIEYVKTPIIHTDGPRWRLQNLFNFRQDRAADVLRQYLTNADLGTRFTAAVGLSRRRDPEALTVLIAESERQGSDDRHHALYRIADYGNDPRAVAALRKAAEDRDERIANAAKSLLKDLEREKAK